MRVATDSDAWSTATTVDEGLATGFSIADHRIRLATVSDVIVTDKVGSLIDVRLNDLLQDSLTLQTDLHRVWWNAPVFEVAGAAGYCTWSYTWFAGYGEAPQTNPKAWFRYRIVSDTGGVWKDVTEGWDVPKVFHASDTYTAHAPGVTFTWEVADVYTADGWVDHAANVPISRTCPP